MLRLLLVAIVVAHGSALVRMRGTAPTSRPAMFRSPLRAIHANAAAPSQEDIEKMQAQRLEALSNQVNAMLTEFPKSEQAALQSHISRDSRTPLDHTHRAL